MGGVELDQGQKRTADSEKRKDQKAYPYQPVENQTKVPVPEKPLLGLAK